jgi:transcription initiation factor TFIIF subunit alpha
MEGDGLITEQEVIDTLRGKVMTTKEFLLSFRKRIKKDPRNRDVITAILKKVAKSNKATDPNSRTLELRSEY